MPRVFTRRQEEAIAQFQLRTASEQHSRRYAALCPVPGADHRAYPLRELSLPGGVSLISGIHFRGPAMSHPFVGVFAQSRWLSSDEMAAAHTALMGEFAAFSPRATRWWAARDEQAPKLTAARADLQLVMGSLAEIRSTPAAALPGHWKLRRVDSASKVGGAFAELYRSFHTARPDLAAAVQPASLDRLDAARAPLVAGTIDARNLPSLRSALRVGRQVVGSWTFIEREEER